MASLRKNLDLVVRKGIFSSSYIISTVSEFSSQAPTGLDVGGKVVMGGSSDTAGARV